MKIMIENLLQQPIESKIDAKPYVKISVPMELLTRINALRIQRVNFREPQHICLTRIIKFYEDHHNEFK